jgi:hypothetical protein
MEPPNTFEEENIAMIVIISLSFLMSLKRTTFALTCGPGQPDRQVQPAVSQRTATISRFGKTTP